MKESSRIRYTEGGKGMRLPKRIKGSADWQFELGESGGSYIPRGPAAYPDERAIVKFKIEELEFLFQNTEFFAQEKQLPRPLKLSLLFNLHKYFIVRARELTGSLTA